MPAELPALDGAAARRWAAAAVSALAAAREEIDALNVYPVPDGDTGTNLHLTFEQGLAALDEVAEDAGVGEVADALARGCLMGARGNSGIIAAQLLRGWADELAGQVAAGAEHARAAFARADAQAWEAVAEPVEGTILSVSRAAARAAAATAAGAAASLAGVVGAAVDAARTALARTPEQLDVLAAAGVVDAGGAGLVVLLEALRDVVTGREVRSPAAAAGERPPVDAGAVAAAAQECGPSGHGYEVMYLLDARDDGVPALRAALRRLGGSVVVVGGGGLWNVHVHTDAPGAAVEAGIAAGRPRRVRITHLDDAVRRAAGTRREASCGVVAFAAGPGLAAVFEEAGAVAVRPASGHRVSTAEVLDAVRSVETTSVVVLPNDPDTLAVAQAAADVARAEGLAVTVLPTRAQVQGLAAVAVHDPDADPHRDALAMSSAAGAARHGAVTVAVRDAITSAGRCRTGDVLGVVDGDFAVIGDDLKDVAVDVVGRLLGGGGELLTLVVGADAPDGLADEVRAAVHRTRPDVEVQVVDGGQERYPLLVGVE